MISAVLRASLIFMVGLSTCDHFYGGTDLEVFDLLSGVTKGPKTCEIYELATLHLH